MLFAKAFQDFNLLLKISAERRKEKNALKGKKRKKKDTTLHDRTAQIWDRKSNDNN